MRLIGQTKSKKMGENIGLGLMTVGDKDRQSTKNIILSMTYLIF
jgi:hypothetical protein